MRILVVSSYLQGILLFRYELVKFLRSQKHCVDILAPKNDTLNVNKDIKKHFEELGVNLFEVKTTRKSFVVFDDFTALYSVHKHASIKKYDIIIFLFPKAYYFLRLGTLNIAARKVSIIDGLGKYYTNYSGQSTYKSIKKYLMRMLLIKMLQLNFFDNGKLCVLNEEDYLFLKKKLYKTKIDLLPFKGSSPKYRVNPSKTINSVYIGRLTYEKGCLDLKKIKDILGEDLKIFGKYDESIRQFDRLEIDGWAENVLDVLNQANFLIITSYREGLSTIVQEAFSQSCVVVAYDVPGVRNLVINGETGFLVKPGDYMSIVRILKLTPRSVTDTIAAKALCFHQKNLDEGKNVINIYRKIFE